MILNSEAGPKGEGQDARNKFAGSKFERPQAGP
jgi:hypothetical protein